MPSPFANPLSLQTLPQSTHHRPKKPSAPPTSQPQKKKPALPSKHPRPASQATPTKADDVAPAPTAAPRDAANTTSTLKQKPPKKPKTPLAPKITLPPPKYHVSRSATNNLPIYTDYKRGGNLHQTTIRRITGDASALRDELRVFLNRKNEDVKVNSLTNQVVIKGHFKGEIDAFLKERGF
ncbi:structural constituent of ribosome [Stemphylium lycopersici]|nr:structural constituent of ribosome [Stemphylium lycopersici]